MSVLVISYSRADRTQVRAVVALLRSALRELDKAVYWDEDFEPGEAWFEQIKSHIDVAPQLFVFWCHHAAASPQVRREFLYAFERNKRVIPVLMDDSPLAPELRPIHGIDARGAVRHGFVLKRLVPWIVAGSVLLAGASFVTLGRLQSKNAAVVEPAPGDPLPPPHPPTAMPDNRVATGPLISAVTVIGLSALTPFVVTRVRKRRVVRQFQGYL